MHFSAQQIASLLHGSIEGNPEVLVHKIAKIEEAEPGSLCFVSNPKYAEHIYKAANSVIILVNEDLVLTEPTSATLIRVKDAYTGFAAILEQYQKMMGGENLTGIDAQSYISPKAKIGRNVYIGAFAYIADGAVIEDNAMIFPNCYIGKNAFIGSDTRLMAGVNVYHNCKIGANCIVHAGTVIGSDGFGFAPLPDGTYKKIPQVGNVIIEDHVEIGANCCIDRATLSSTIIRKGVKLDNLIQIAHNVEIDENTVIAAQSGVAGSSRIGKNCVIGGQAGIVGHIKIADKTSINAQSGVSKSVSTPGTALNGTPAFDYKSVLKSQAIFRHLPEMEQRIHVLEQLVEQLTNRIKE